jgi:glutamine---fructose-6-phosphate transaminase (isomerizing)
MATRCVRCLLPDTYPGVTFNDDGLCNFCQDYKKPALLGEDCFLEKIHSKHGKNYDAIIGISGGKDSSYMAYVAKKKLGLRVLAVSYDFMYMVDLARENAKTVCDDLGIDLLVVKSNDNFEYGYLRNLLTSLAPTNTTWGQCMFCHYGIEAILFEAAQSREIPFILSGVTSHEVWWNPGNRMKILRKHLSSLPIQDKAFFAMYQSKAYMNLVDQRRQFPIPENSRLTVYKKPNWPSFGPEIVKMFDYIEWDSQTIEKTLLEETGWQKPPTRLTWRYDCLLEPLLDYTYMKEFGISAIGLYVANLLRAGNIEMEEARQIMAESEEQQRINSGFKTVMDMLDIPEKVQNRYFDNNGS